MPHATPDPNPNPDPDPDPDPDPRPNPNPARLVLLYRFSCYAAIYGFLLFSVVGALFVSGCLLLLRNVPSPSPQP